MVNSTSKKLMILIPYITSVHVRFYIIYNKSIISIKNIIKYINTFLINTFSR